jgi:hypothetical protein
VPSDVTVDSSILYATTLTQETALSTTSWWESSAQEGSGEGEGSKPDGQGSQNSQTEGTDESKNLKSLPICM